MARPWINYIARTSALLQQGRNVVDVAYFYGEEAPVSVQMKNGRITDLPRRHAYDFVSAKGLLEELTVEGGEIVSRGGARYKALYLGGTSRKMTVPVLRKLAALVDAGATVIGEAPQATPSLHDDPAEFAGLVKRLWSGPHGVRSGVAVEPALAAAGVAPDFAYAAQPDSDIQFVHRRREDGDLYFVSNRKLRAERLEARFRVNGKAPELWRADDGSRTPVSYCSEGGATLVPLTLAAGESVFVLFRKPTTATSLALPGPVRLLGSGQRP